MIKIEYEVWIQIELTILKVHHNNTFKRVIGQLLGSY